MAKWNKGLMATMEEFEEAEQSSVTGTINPDNEVLGATIVARDISETQDSIDTAVQGAQELQNISDALQETDSSPKAEQIAQMAVESVYNRLGISRRTPSLESFKNRSFTVSLEASIGDIWKAIKKAVANVWNSIKGFFSRIFGFSKTAEEKVDEQKDKLKTIEQVAKQAGTEKKGILVSEDIPLNHFQPKEYITHLTFNATFNEKELPKMLQHCIEVFAKLANMTNAASVSLKRLNNELVKISNDDEANSVGYASNSIIGEMAQYMEPIMQGLLDAFKKDNKLIGELEFDVEKEEFVINHTNVNLVKEKIKHIPIATKDDIDKIWDCVSIFSKHKSDFQKVNSNYENMFKEIDHVLDLMIKTDSQDGIISKLGSKLKPFIHKMNKGLSNAIGVGFSSMVKSVNASLQYVDHSLSVMNTHKTFLLPNSTQQPEPQQKI